MQMREKRYFSDAADIKREKNYKRHLWICEASSNKYEIDALMFPNYFFKIYSENFNINSNEDFKKLVQNVFYTSEKSNETVYSSLNFIHLIHKETQANKINVAYKIKLNDQGNLLCFNYSILIKV